MIRPLIEDGATVRIDGLVGTLRLEDGRWRFDWADGTTSGRRFYDRQTIEAGVRHGTVVAVEEPAPSTDPAEEL